MNTQCEKTVYLRYINDTLLRLGKLSLGIVVCEMVKIGIDFANHLLDEPVNYLHLLAHLLLIVSSIGFYLFCRHAERSGAVPVSKKKNVIVVNRSAIMIAVLLFIYCDLCAWHKTIGSYIAFLFVLQLTPSYRGWINSLHFFLMCVYSITLYACLVNSSPKSYFFIFVTYVCLALSSDYLRYFFKHKLEEQYKAEDSYNRYMRLTEQSIVALAGAVEAKDKYTKGHSHRVAEYSREIARRLGYDEQQQQDVYQIGLMHDIGKIGVPDAVINKPAKLTDEEFAEI